MSEEEIKKLIGNMASQINQVQGTLLRHGKRLDDVEDRVERIEDDIERAPDFAEGLDEQK